MTSPPRTPGATTGLPDPLAGKHAAGTEITRRRHPGGPADQFYIVGIGASAGGIEALEQFFRNVPPSPGVAFVVVMHLAPSPDGHLPVVLQNFTSLPVLQAHDGLKVRPNEVYVIPPDRDMSLLHGTLLLLPPAKPRGQRLPIDHFFQSLANDARERAICIILSGLGNDGTIGLKMVMENFGMVMVQDPKTAAFNSMPRSAIATEFVDFVLPPSQLPAKLLEYVDKPKLVRPVRQPEDLEAKQPDHALQKIFLLIRTQTGHDFSFYKRNTVFRRIERRMNSHHIKEFAHYVRYLQENPQEVEQLFSELLIGVTKFFRDQDAFVLLKQFLRPVLQAKPLDSTIRVWAPGCSTGEEAYSLAILLLELLEELEPTHTLKIQIFATDINPDGIDFARAGRYPATIRADVNEQRLQRFFHNIDGAYQIRKEVRDLVMFAQHDINKNAPFIRLDLLCCRNLLIYLNSELQKNLLSVFHYALNPGALLFLGPSENMTGLQEQFAPLDVKWKISRRTETPTALTHLVNFPFARHSAIVPPISGLMNPTATRRDSGPFATLVQRALLRSYAPPAVVINGKGEILYVHGRTGKYLEPAPGLSSMNLFEMAREELNFEISGAVHRANQERTDVTVDNVRVKTEAGQQLLRLSVRHLQEPEQLAGLLLVVFEDQPTPRRMRQSKNSPDPAADLSRDAVVAALNKELQYTKHRLQTTIEEMESSLEELKSTNEELQSANEELQSTNEEFMTNKEEMQSLNEELMTLNMQYQSKSEELGHAANDMKNLLDATEIAIIFLDNDMVITRFTPPVARIINLVASDIGRPISHFASGLRHDHLLQDIQQVLDRLVSIETTIQTLNGEWYAMRILPYRTLDNYINGAVVTFTDITELKRLEAQRQYTMRFAESIVETVREPIMALDHNLQVLTISRSFASQFGLDATAVRGQALGVLNAGVWSHRELHNRLRELLDTDAREFEDFRLEADFPGMGRRHVLLYASRIQGPDHQTNGLLLGMQALSEV
ncbi:chemotaxis protein CheB [Hymenobacter sediminicola]|uniref:protein-glutamate O-methyltransferase n=1 Tax=Hymenobacter sediminicola TaxID=2761579 RepID=A0A7G7WBK2_9BACT|nr:chemotaxis protein CheB [Hymenobacter sediminicola]QNH63745.1 PAS domain-containing protein [Hymenobacter sediminicola]